MKKETMASVVSVESPLTRVGVALSSGASHLIMLESGQAHLQSADGTGPTHLDAPRLIWRVDGGGHQLLAQSGVRGRIVSIPQVALMMALPATLLGEQMRRTLSQNLSLSFENDAKLRQLVKGLQIERRAEEPGAELVSGHYLSLLLVAIWRIARADLVAHGRSPQGLAERFVLMVGKRLPEQLAVQDYAEALGVNRDRLGSAVRRATGLSPQAYIHQQVVREASELLANTGMPVSRVAFRLGYSDPAYFTRFFQRHRGDSPLKFRRKAREKRAIGDLSYAAWP